VSLAVAGNEAAFDALVARYRKPLLLYCSRMLPSDRAEDVVQEALLRTYAVLRSGETPAKLRPWLFQVAHNAAVDALRARPPAPVELDPEIGDTHLPERLIESRDTTRQVFAAVSALPDRQRDAIVLRELEGRSYDDIGRRLGASRSAVRQLIVRARQTVRAAAASFAPAGLLTRFPWLGNSVAGHSAELSAGAGISAAGAQVWVTALVTCTMGGSVVVLSRSDEQPDAATKAAIAGPAAATLALSAERTADTLLSGEARQTQLGRELRAERVSAPAAGVHGATPKQQPVEAERQGEIAPAPPVGCAPTAGPPAGSAKRRRQARRRSRRACDPGGPLAVGNTGPNDPPLGGQLVPEQNGAQPNPAPAPQDPKTQQPEQPAPPPATGTDPREGPADSPPATEPVPLDPAPLDPVEPDPVQP
jgi:RNA polymerase sigma factor (sigma-70 family)